MRCDVTVVGAGPAGTTVARFLAKEDLRVVLLEKESFPREKPCGGMLSFRVFERFAHLKNEMGEPLVSKSYGVHLYAPSLRTRIQHLAGSSPVFMILRREFDHLMAQVAIDCGAELVTNRVIDLTLKSDAVKVLLDDNTTIESSILIGADGVNSVIAKELGLLPAKGSKNLALCAVAELEIGKKAVEAYLGERRPIHLFLGFDDLLGYAWLFPKASHVNIGVGGILSETEYIERSYMKFVQVLRKMKLMAKHIQPDNFSAALIPVGGPIARTFTDRVILCGDAAGFVHPLTGEGIYYAMASGEIASKVAAEAIEYGDCTSGKLSEYQATWMEDFGKELKIAANLQRMFGRFIRIPEIAIQIAAADKNLKKIYADLCLGRISLNRTLMGKLLSRLPISVGKYVRKKKSEERIRKRARKRPKSPEEYPSISEAPTL